MIVTYFCIKRAFIIMTNRRRFGAGGNERKKKSKVDPRFAS